MLFIDAKSTLRAFADCGKRESPVRARKKLTSYTSISTEDPGRFFRLRGGVSQNRPAPKNLANSRLKINFCNVEKY